MPRWAWVVVVLAVALYGWLRTAEMRARGAHEVVAVNRTGRLVEDLRVRVGGHELHIAALAPGATARRPLRCERDGTFELSWRSEGEEQPLLWEGGRFHHGPLRMRHRFDLVRGEGVVWRSERITVPAPAGPRERRRG